MSKRRPKIGVTGPVKGGTAAWLFTKLAIWLQGGVAVRVTPDSKIDFHTLDGLVLGGGADIHPEQYGRHPAEEVYGETDSKTSGSVGFSSWVKRIFSLIFYPFLFLVRKLFAVSAPANDRKRDKLELRLLEVALNRRLPVLGICRGAQLINVKLGGTLHQDIKRFYGEVPHIYSIWPRKEVEVDKCSNLGKIIGTSAIGVNALHHQAVETLGKPLEAVAKEESGIIQAIELPDHPYFIGVQWHPEYMPQVQSQRSLFRQLIECAGNSS